MRVCQFRHFGTGIASGFRQIDSKFESRKSRTGCQGLHRSGGPALYLEAQSSSAIPTEAKSYQKALTEN
jgi:hypothetical protein